MIRIIIMKSKFILFRRAGVFYSEDTTTGKQHSLRTKDEAEALTLLHSKNEAHRQPVLNLQIARTYLTATDPEVANRTWQTAMDELTKTKSDTTRTRSPPASQSPRPRVRACPLRTRILPCYITAALIRRPVANGLLGGDVH